VFFGCIPVAATGYKHEANDCYCQLKEFRSGQHGVVSSSSFAERILQSGIVRRIAHVRDESSLRNLKVLQPCSVSICGISRHVLPPLRKARIRRTAASICFEKIFLTFFAPLPAEVTMASAPGQHSSCPFARSPAVSGSDWIRQNAYRQAFPQIS
jgi:hypothetical protein